MKKLYFTILFASNSLLAQVGVNTTDPKAQLDVSPSSVGSPIATDGILIPRVTAFPTGVGVNQNGMLIFLSATVGSKTVGFYYWDNPSSSWIGMNSNQTTTYNVSDAIDIEDFLFDEYGGAAGPNTNGKNDNQYSFTPIIENGGISNIESAVTGNSYAGIHQLSTGTSNNNSGRAAVGSFDWVNKIRPGGHEIIFEMRVRFPVLSSAGLSYIGQFGLSNLAFNNIASATVSSGIYFGYSTSGIVGTCRDATNAASSTSAFTAVANTWYKLKAVVNATRTNVDFYVDGIKIGFVTSNIPSSTSGMKFISLLEKVTTTTTASTCDIDYVTWKMIR